MSALIEYVIDLFVEFVLILDSIRFPGFGISLLHLLLSASIISFVFKFIFGGMKEIDTGVNFMNPHLVSRSINNFKRKVQVNNINKGNGNYKYVEEDRNGYKYIVRKRK